MHIQQCIACSVRGLKKSVRSGMLAFVANGETPFISTSQLPVALRVAAAGWRLPAACLRRKKPGEGSLRLLPATDFVYTAGVAVLYRGAYRNANIRTWVTSNAARSMTKLFIYRRHQPNWRSRFATPMSGR